MKIVKINDDLKINIDCIYSLQCQNNDNDILKWEESYNELMQEYYDNPPLLALDNDELYKPEYGETIDNDKLSKYTDALKAMIDSACILNNNFDEQKFNFLTNEVEKIYNNFPTLKTKKTYSLLNYASKRVAFLKKQLRQ